MTNLKLYCSNCKKELNPRDAYEYRGVYSCDDCFEIVEAKRNAEREEIINEEYAKTAVFKGLDLDPNYAVGKANREILAKQIEITSKESPRLAKYEGREDPFRSKKKGE